MALVLEKPVQHFAESFRLAAHSSRLEVVVMFWTENKGGQFDEGFDRHVHWDVDLYSGYRWKASSGSKPLRMAVNFIKSIRALNPDVVVCFGWATVIARLAVMWCVVTRTPFLFFGDSTWQHSEHPRRRWVRAILLRVVFRLAWGALSTGTFNREFYIQFGMNPNRIFQAVYPIDVASYAKGRQQRTRTNAGQTVIGFAGKLIQRKGVDELLRALALIAHDNRWEARIIGDGEERGRLETLARSLGISDRVRFIGFRNTSKMPSELAACDVVVVPSTFDLRVLVVAEAMTTGAAVVVSSNTAVWGRGDLVEDGVTGRVYQSGDERALARVLEELIDSPRSRAAIQSAGTIRAAAQGPEAFANGLEHAVAAVGGFKS